MLYIFETYLEQQRNLHNLCQGWDLTWVFSITTGALTLRYSIRHRYVSFHDMLWYPTYLIWSKVTPFEAMTGRTVFIDGLLADLSWVFLSYKINFKRFVHSPRCFIIIITLIIFRQLWLTCHSGQVARNPDRSW